MTSTAKPKAHSSSLPINTLDTSLARLFTHIHPILLLGFYSLRFDALVQDPVSALLASSVPVAALQIAYLVICFAPAGAGDGVTSSPPVGKPAKGQRRKAAVVKGEVSVGGRVMVSVPELLERVFLG
jgi:phosphatidylinositol glycan class F